MSVKHEKCPKNTEDPLFMKQLLIMALYTKMQNHGQCYVATLNNGQQPIDEWRDEQLGQL